MAVGRKLKKTVINRIKSSFSDFDPMQISSKNLFAVASTDFKQSHSIKYGFNFAASSSGSRLGFSTRLVQA